MEGKVKVILTYGGDVTDMLLLSEEQLRLLQYLFDEEYFDNEANYEIMGKETQFREI